MFENIAEAAPYLQGIVSQVFSMMEIFVVYLLLRVYNFYSFISKDNPKEMVDVIRLEAKMEEIRLYLLIVE